MSHRKHSHESDHRTKVTCPLAQTSRSKSYPRDERNQKKEHGGKHKHKKNNYSHNPKDDTTENHSKHCHRKEKKHDKLEKNKYNIEKYLKEKNKISQNSYKADPSISLKTVDQVKKLGHTRKSKEKTPNHDSLLDLMNLEYYISPVHVSPEKEKLRSKSGEGKRSKDKDSVQNNVFGMSCKTHSRSQDDCKHKEEKKYSRAHRADARGNPPDTPRRHRKSNLEKSDKKHKDKHLAKPGSSRKSHEEKTAAEPLYSGLYKFFRLERSEVNENDPRDIDQVKHFVSSQHDSREMIPTNTLPPRNKRKHDRDRRYHKEPQQKKSDDDMKKYLLKIQNMIDEKLNYFLHKTASIPATSSNIFPNDPENRAQQQKKGYRRKKHKDVRTTALPEPQQRAALTCVGEPVSGIKQEMSKIFERQELQVVENEISDENQKKSLFSHERKTNDDLTANRTRSSKKNENSRLSSPSRNYKSDSTPKKSRTSVASDKFKSRTPRKKWKTLECKTVSIVSIAPQENIDRIKKTYIKVPEIGEDRIERKKKSKRFQKYYNYTLDKNPDSESNSSAEKSVLSDSFKNVLDSSENMPPEITIHETTKKICMTEGNLFDLSEHQICNSPQYWADWGEQIWKPQSLLYPFDRETRLNCMHKPNLNSYNYDHSKILEQNPKLIAITRSKLDDGFIKIYSNKCLKLRGSSSESELSKSSIRCPDQTKVNLKLIVGPHQIANEYAKLSVKGNNQNHTEKPIEYLELKNYFGYQKAEDQMSRIERLLNNTSYLGEMNNQTLSPEQQNNAYHVPKSFISKLLEEVSMKRTSDIGVGTESITDFKRKDTTANAKVWSHISVQADLMNIVNLKNKDSSEQIVSTQMKKKHIGVEAGVQYIEQDIQKGQFKTSDYFRDQCVQISLDPSETKKAYTKVLKLEVSKNSLGVSTSLPFLREQRRSNLRTQRSSILRGTIGTVESTVASLLSFHKIHGDKVSSSNKSNSHSLNEYFIKPLMNSSPRRSSLFLTKQYRTTEQSSYQKRKIYDEKIRRRIRRRTQHMKEFSPQVFEVRFLSVEKTKSQSDPFPSCKAKARDYVHPAFGEHVQKPQKNKTLGNRYSRSRFSYTIQDVDSLWKSRRKNIHQSNNEKKDTIYFARSELEIADPKIDKSAKQRENVQNLKGVIDFICKSLVTYYHNTNFREHSNEKNTKRLNKNSFEALYYSDHFQKDSSSSNCFSDLDSKSSASDSKCTRSAEITSKSSTNCRCYNNSCPRLNSADSFFDYPYIADKNVNPTILGFALDDKMIPPDSYRKKESCNNISLSEESGYATDGVKTDLPKDFFKKPTIAALLLPYNHQNSLSDLLCSQTKISEKCQQCLMLPSHHPVKVYQKESASTVTYPNHKSQPSSVETLASPERSPSSNSRWRSDGKLLKVTNKNCPLENKPNKSIEEGKVADEPSCSKIVTEERSRVVKKIEYPNRRTTHRELAQRNSSETLPDGKWSEILDTTSSVDEEISDSSKQVFSLKHSLDGYQNKEESEERDMSVVRMEDQTFEDRNSERKTSSQKESFNNSNTCKSLSPAQLVIPKGQKKISADEIISNIL